MEKVTCHTTRGEIAVCDSAAAGRAVILVHGNSLSSESYIHQLSGEPGRRWRLVAFDLPGHGDSPRVTDPAGTCNFTGYTAILRELVASLGIQRPAVVGHSLGGHIAIQAIAHGLEVSSLLIFGTPPMGDPPDFPAAFYLDSIGDLFFRAKVSESEIARMAELCMPEGAPPPSYYMRSIAATDPQARESLGISMNRDNPNNEKAVLASLMCPVAVVMGECDRIVRLPYFRGLHIPTLWRGSVQVIKGAGHCPQHDDPESFNRILTDFLIEQAE